MFLANIFVKIAIIAGCVILFLVTFILNKRTKAPKIDESIQKCKTCTNESCVIKLSDIDKIKKEYEEELKKHKGKSEIVDAIKTCQEEEKDEK